MANLSDAQADIFGDVSLSFVVIVFVRDRLLAQIRELYRERATIERDYAAKLMALAQKAVEKKNKKMALAVVGDEPSKQWNDDTLVQRCGSIFSLNAPHLIWGSTLENAYSKIIASFVNSQQEHLNLADALNVQIVGVLTSLARKNESHRKKASCESSFLLRFLNSLSSKHNFTRRSWRIRIVSTLIVPRYQVISNIFPSSHRHLYVCLHYRAKIRYGGAIESHGPGDAYLYQYDDECAEVENYRQKQV